MTDEEKREQVITGLADLLRTTPFQVEYRVRKKPQGIHVIIDVTQEQMDTVAKQAIDKSKRIEKV